MNKLDKFSRKTKSPGNFPVQFESFTKPVYDPDSGASYIQFVVTANGLVVAHFISETDLKTYLNYIGQYGIGTWPKSIIEILEAQFRTALKIKKSTND